MARWLPRTAPSTTAGRGQRSTVTPWDGKTGVIQHHMEITANMVAEPSPCFRHSQGGTSTVPTPGKSREGYKN